MVCVFCVHKKVSSDECLVFVVSATKISTWKMSLSFFLFLFLSLSLSLNDLSIFSIAVLFLGISLLILDKCSVLFVRWFWAPFFEQVVFAVGLFVVTSASDVFASRQEALSPLRLSI